LCLRPARGRLLVGDGPFLFGRWAKDADAFWRGPIACTRR
jgi:hypothetical protein